MKYTIIFSLVLLTSCQKLFLPHMRRVKSIHYTDDFSERRAVGQAKGKSCRKEGSANFSIGGSKYKVEDSKQITSQEALDDLEKSYGGIAYATEVILDHETSTVSGFGKSCFTTSGQGFK